ncbi:MAG: nucleotide pyrophosphohydrolase [Myxococcota bacterium]
MSGEDGWSDERTPLAEVRERLRAFNRDREWGQFHKPKDLAMAVTIEAGELLEPFLWKAEGEDLDVDRIREEIADVIICAVNLAGRLDIDLLEAVEAKIRRNAEKYPVEQARGRADKYDQLDQRSAGPRAKAPSREAAESSGKME